MQATAALKELLEELGTATYDEFVEVRMNQGGGSHASLDGSYVQVDPAFAQMIDPDISGPNDLRVIIDVHSHEMEHVRSSDLEGKKNFMESYPACTRAAGYVHNVLEDEWVDAQRVRRFPGHRRSRAMLIKLLMADAEPIGDKRNETAMLSGLYQLARGRHVRGYADADDDVKRFLAECEPHIESARVTDSTKSRDENAHAVMDLLLSYADHPDAPDDLNAAADYVMGEGEGDEPLPDVDVPDDAEATEADDSDDAEESDGEGDGESDDDADDTTTGGSGNSDEEADDADDESEDGGNSESDDDVDERVDDISERDDEAVNEKYGVDDPEETSDADVRRFNRYQKKLDEYDTDLEAKRRDRDDRVKNGSIGGSSDQIRDRAERSGVIGDIETRFLEYTTRDQPRTAEEGSRLDIRNVVRHASGDYGETELYEEHQAVETGSRAIGVAMDASWSMRHDMEDAKLALAAVARATDIIGDKFIATAYTDADNYEEVSRRHMKPTGKNADGTPNTLDMRLVTAADESFEYEHLDSFDAANNTPTAAGAKFTYELLREVEATEKLLIVVTDGEANVTIDGHLKGGDPAMDDMYAVAEEARKDGVAVVGIGFGGAHDYMLEHEFGEGEYRVTDIDSLADDLIDLYESQLNSDAVR